MKKEDTIGIEKALRKLHQLSQCEGENDAQKKLQRMNCLLSKKNLFDIALGTYDLDLAMFVAEAMGSNSRENVDFLNSFKKLESGYMRYKIDIHLKRYASALKNIARLPGRFDECAKLIREQQLYAQGLKHFVGTRHEYAFVASAYAEVLQEKGKHREAGILYTKANELKKALEAFKKANSWRDAIATAFKLQLR
jgi:elongator complex protein 1